MEGFMNFMIHLNYQVFLITLVFILMDIVTGYGQALANKMIKSEKMRQGFWHKLAIILALIVAGMVDIAIQLGIGEQLGFVAPIFECACIYIMAMELTSILENIVKMNPELTDSKFMSLFANDLTKTPDHATIVKDGAASNG